MMVYLNVMVTLLMFLLKCHVKSLKRSQFDWHSWRIQFKSVLKTLHIQMHHDLSLINQSSKAENVLHKRSSQVCRISLLSACKRSEKLNEKILFHACFLSCKHHICVQTGFSPSHLLFHTPAALNICVFHSNASVCVCAWL